MCAFYALRSFPLGSVCAKGANRSHVDCPKSTDCTEHFNGATNSNVYSDDSRECKQRTSPTLNCLEKIVRVAFVTIVVLFVVFILL